LWSLARRKNKEATALMEAREAFLRTLDEQGFEVPNAAPSLVQIAGQAGELSSTHRKRNRRSRDCWGGYLGSKIATVASEDAFPEERNQVDEGQHGSC
jgi:hypothetical protein